MTTADRKAIRHPSGEARQRPAAATMAMRATTGPSLRRPAGAVADRTKEHL